MHMSLVKPSFFNHIHRRDHNSEAMDEYCSELLDIHEQVTNKIAESILAKVEVLYGAKAPTTSSIDTDIRSSPFVGRIRRGGSPAGLRSKLPQSRLPVFISPGYASSKPPSASVLSV